MSENNYINYKDIAKELGLNKFDTLLISSNIKNIAKKAIRNEGSFNPDNFINSFANILEEGTLLFPAFTDRIKNKDIFSINSSLPNTGTLSKKAFSRDDFVRSYDPIHSFMIKGMFADEAASLENNSTFGPDSVFAFLHSLRAKMLIIDVDFMNSFTFVHYVEEYFKVKYRKYKKLNIHYYDKNNNYKLIEHYFYKRKLHIANNLDNLEKLFEEKGISQIKHINGSRFTIVDLNRAFNEIKKDIEKNNCVNLYKVDYNLFIRQLAKNIINSIKINS